MWEKDFKIWEILKESIKGRVRKERWINYWEGRERRKGGEEWR